MNRKTLFVLATVVVCAATALYSQPWPLTPIASCVRSETWPPALFHLTNAGSLGIFAAYVWIPVVLLRLRPKLGIPLDWIFLLFAAFILSCGVTHAAKVLTGYYPWYWLGLDLEVLTAIISLGTAAALTWFVAPKLEAEAVKYRRALAVERGRTEEAERGREREAGDRLAAESAAEQLKLALGREQALVQALAESSAPILKLPNRTLALVVVGAVAAERAQALMVRACQAVQEERSRRLIIDVSAVQEMDTAAVAALGQVAQSVANMGARVVFAGIRSEIAMAMARMGVRFEGAAGTALDAEAAMLMLEESNLARKPGETLAPSYLMSRR